MPNLIILRLHPAEPISGSEFSNYLTGLTINAYDLTFDNSSTGVLIGTANGLADPHLAHPTNNNVNINNKLILQHYIDIIDPFTGTTRHLEAAATAVVVVNTPAGHPEYPTSSSFDIRLEIKRGGLDIIQSTIEYNVMVTNVGALSTNQKIYFNMAASVYVSLPSSTVGLDPNLAYVDLPADGQPPKFDDLVKAINLVLAKDPDNVDADLEHLSPLTPGQSRHVVAEIVWNRTLYPPPDLPQSLEKMYTKPDADSDEVEMDRMLFEAQVRSYHATHDAEAVRLAGFVFAASAAVACEQLSAKAASAGLKFPLITGASTATTIPNATVVLSHQFALNPPFTVPAAYFYAIGAMLPPQVNAKQRYDMARRETESRLLSEFQTAIDAGAIVVPAKPVTVPAAPSVNPNQAARRLDALGSTEGSFPKVILTPPVTIIVQDWLNYTDVNEKIDTLFWTSEVAVQPTAYLQLILHAVTKNHQVLIDAILSTVTSVSDLVKIWDQQWRDFFLNRDSTLPLVPPPDFAFPPPASTPPRLDHLPPFTQPGTPVERVETFICHLRKFFTIQFSSSGPKTETVANTPTIVI